MWDIRTFCFNVFQFFKLEYERLKKHVWMPYTVEDEDDDSGAFLGRSDALAKFQPWAVMTA